jgi:hypothetical protein
MPELAGDSRQQLGRCAFLAITFHDATQANKQLKNRMHRK